MPAATTSGRALTVGLLLSGVLLAGCGQPENPYALPEYDAKATGVAATASPAPRADRSRSQTRSEEKSPEVDYEPGDALGQGAWVERGRIVARTAAERAAVRSVVTYLS